MTIARVRIGKVRLKAGGADLHVLTRETADGFGENWRGRMVEHARSIAGDMSSDLTGYIVIGFFADGSHDCGCRIDLQNDRVPIELWPAYAEEAVRRYTVTKRQILEEMGG